MGVLDAGPPRDLLRRLLITFVVVLAAGGASCVPPSPEQILERNYPDTTRMGQIQRSGTLTIGVTSNQPPLGFSDPRTGEAAGITASLGQMVGKTLGVRAEFVIEPSRRLLSLTDEGEIDIAFPNLPLTEEKIRAHAFTTPYLVAHQRLLVRKPSAIAGLEDLSRRKVCAAINDTTQVSPEVLEPLVRVVTADQQSCLSRFERGEVDAVSAADIYLQWMRDELGADTPAKIVGDQLSTEGYGAAVSPGDGWLPFVNAVFSAAEEDGTWTAAYKRWVGAAPEGPPELTAEEAAALFPSGGEQ